MELIISRTELSKLLSVTQSIVEKKTLMPILANVLLSAGKDELKVSASDLEVTAVISAKANVKSSGSTTVNARVFADIIRELPDGDVQIKLTDGERIEVTAQNTKLKIIGSSAEEYPGLPGIGIECKSRIKASEFLWMISKSLYAASQDETRFSLNGVYFELVGDSKKSGKSGSDLRMVGTDAHRLAMITRNIPGLKFKENFIVPRKGLVEIKKIIDDEQDKDIGIELHDGFLVIETGNVKASMRLVDGEFPDYSRIIPNTKGSIAKVNSGEFEKALRRAALLVSDKGKCVRLDFSKNSLRIASFSPELGEGSDVLSIEYSGEQLSIGFNARYLADVAASLQESETLVLELHGKKGPGKFYPESDESYISIVMPMRLDSENRAAA